LEFLELGIGTGGPKTRMMELPGQEGSLTISSAVVDTIHQRDRQTDRWTDTGRQQRPRLCIIASRGKKSSL